MIWFGTIVNTHGLKGEVKVLSNTSFEKERFRKGNKFFCKIDDEYIELILKSYRKNKSNFLVFFQNLDSIEKAEFYKNRELYVEKSLSTSEKPYLHDYLEFEIIGHDLKNYGKVDDIMETSNYISFYKKGLGNIPKLEKFIEKIDFENKKIYIKEIEYV